MADPMRGGAPRFHENEPLRFDRLGKSVHQGINNPTVKLLALASHHSGIGRILNQYMLEEVGRIRWFTAGEDQLASRKVLESVS